MPTRRYSKKVYRQEVEPTEYLSTLTPAGIVQSYGNAFCSMRSTNPRRRRAALVFTALFLLPIGVVALGWTMVLLHSL